jgi:hypothetical protein
MSEQAYDAEIAALENALAGLVPVSGKINRDRILFRAGQASMQRHRWIWPAATGGMALVAAVLGGVLAWGPQPTPEKQIVYFKEAPKPAPRAHQWEEPKPALAPSTQAEAIEPAGSQSPYFQMQNQLLRWGLDGLPALPPTPAPEQPLTRRRLLGQPAAQPPAPVYFPMNFLQKLGDHL